MNKFLISAGITFALAIAMVFATRVSTDALTLFIGFVLGATTTGAIALGFLWLQSRQLKAATMTSQRQPGSGQPSVIVVPTGGQALPWGDRGATALPMSSEEREFNIIGYADEDEGEADGNLVNWG